MKLHIISDLHFETEPYDISKMPDADVLILAGDILRLSHLKNEDIVKGYHLFMTYVSERYRNVLVIMGNHEHYRFDFAKSVAAYQEFLKPYTNIRLLDNHTAIIDNVMFIGATMWSNLRNGNPDVMYETQRGVTDFHVIENNGLRFTVNDCMGEFEKSAHKIHRLVKLNESELKCVVITHHSPSYRSIHPKWGNDPINYYFSSNCEKLMDGVDLWIHGHTHDSFDYMVDKTRVVCNPKGYGNENRSFNPSLVVEV